MTALDAPSRPTIDAHLEDQLAGVLETVLEDELGPKRVVVQAYLPHVKNFNPRFDPMRDLVYRWPGGPLAVGDLVECPATPRGDGRPFQAIVVSLDASDHPYKGPVKTIIRRIEQ